MADDVDVWNKSWIIPVDSVSRIVFNAALVKSKRVPGVAEVQHVQSTR